MLALAVLFGLLVWLGLTVLAAYLCGKLTSKLGLGRWIGRFVGFMLLMGGWMVSWATEYWTLRQTAQAWCKNAGLTVYVTPEEYWEKISEQERQELKIVQERVKDGRVLVFENRKYKISYRYNNRIVSYTYDEFKPYTVANYEIFYDEKDRVVLLKNMKVSVGVPAIANDLEGLKFWLETVQGCDSFNEWKFQQKYLR
ncbi:transglycosylase-associated protein [Neisseria wadsworthii]|uniref:Transglycosylase-associated protein n=1 Tax=Neisseria wadsworthii 9715 TaxID=1030841 RepID=G4CN23_9NEIS|nr:transglycosylase-associated protein [Neisseria wadsworthii]EGZ50775.1 transglycosylase-associated protein [Neisseria wadsworthii 9715]QMT36477.1 transglycosylase-associated protein [Neisseria wadsworthii]